MDQSSAALFFDGRSAGRKSARVELSGAGLRIRSHPEGAMLAEWPFESITVLAPPAGGRGFQFTSSRQEDARLSIADNALAEIVATRAEGVAAPARRRRRITSTAATAAGVLGLLAVAYLAWTPVLDLAANAIPASWERKLGLSAVATLAPADKRCRQEAGQAALDRLVARLAAAIGPDARFDVQVSRGTTVNAFAMPGGYIVLLSKLVDEAQSGEEIAGVLAHEMAHVVERHSVRLMLRHYGLSLLASVLIGDSKISGALSAFGLLAYSRDFEAQADARAFDILEKAGIRNGGLASFFERLEKKEGDLGLLRYLGTHPATAERKALAQRTPETGTAAMSAADWQALRAICAGTS